MCVCVSYESFIFSDVCLGNTEYDRRLSDASLCRHSKHTHTHTVCISPFTSSHLLLHHNKNINLGVCADVQLWCPNCIVLPSPWQLLIKCLFIALQLDGHTDATHPIVHASAHKHARHRRIVSNSWRISRWKQKQYKCQVQHAATCTLLWIPYSQECAFRVCVLSQSLVGEASLGGWGGEISGPHAVPKGSQPSSSHCLSLFLSSCM